MKSVISASMHKAGSTIMDMIVADVATIRGYEINQISRKVPKSPLNAREVFISSQDSMVLEGAYYGVARGPYISEMPIIEKLKVIVQVRDPRDCITSAYFSYKISHVLPKNPEKAEKFKEWRKNIGALEIDEYALSETKGYKNRMKILREITESHDDALLLRYEDMVTDTAAWLERIGAFLDQPINGEVLEQLGDKIDFSIKSEDVTKHKRQVTPGDHLRKLLPETVSAMNEQMQDELRYFGYGD